MEMIEENKIMRRLLGMPAAPDIDTIKDTVSLVIGIKWDEIVSRSRRGELPLARSLFSYVGTIRFGIHPMTLAKAIKRDRTTVYHGVESVSDKLHVKSPLETGMLKQINTILDNVYNQRGTTIGERARL
jgi:chromosomal replication initiation ATPase DnaA